MSLLSQNRPLQNITYFKPNLHTICHFIGNRFHLYVPSNLKLIRVWVIKKIKLEKTQCANTRAFQKPDPFLKRSELHMCTQRTIIIDDITSKQ